MRAEPAEILRLGFTADAMAALALEGSTLATNAAATGEAVLDGISHDGDDAAFKASHIGGKGYNSVENAVRLSLGTPLPTGTAYIISAWVYVPSEGNAGLAGKGDLIGPGILLSGNSGDGTYKFPASVEEAGKISFDQWINVTFKTSVFDVPIQFVDFRFYTNDEETHPELWYLDDISIAVNTDVPVILTKEEVSQLVSNRTLLYSSALDSVSLSDPYMLNAAEKDVAYLLALQSKRFLHHFYNVAGLTPPAESYKGWEGYNGGSYWNFRGHMFGHYMSALSQAYLSDQFGNKDELLVQIKDAVEGLKECQDAYAAANPEGAGYISAFPEVDLDIVQGSGDESQRTVWVPWYNLHKVLAGLVDIYQNVQDDSIRDTALEVASAFGDYIFGRTQKLSNRNTLLATEYGGMNDALYELYNITGNVNHRKAAECFDETNLFTQLQNYNDVLSGKHANTTIPKLIGALKRYTVLSQNEEYYNSLSAEEQEDLPGYLLAAMNFWDIVIGHHTYVTGGNSQGEHFRAPDSLGKYVQSEKTCETCNTYNMLKLTEELYKITGDKKYADYYENTFINAILSSQNPETGMMTYFQPMGAGFNKVYNSEYEHFYCCTGTGIESFTRLNSAIYHSDGAKSVYVNMYFSSEFSYNDISLKQEANVPNSDRITITVSSQNNASLDGYKLYLRVPDWSGAPLVSINGNETTLPVTEGYLCVENLAQGDTIEVNLPMHVSLHSLPDTPEIVAFRYGPVVLSTGLGVNDITKTASDGVNVRIAVLDPAAPQTIDLAKGVSVDDWKAAIEDNLVRVADSEDGQVRFRLRAAVSDFVYTPHFARYKDRYGLYMALAETEGEEHIWEEEPAESEEPVTETEAPLETEAPSPQTNVENTPPPEESGGGDPGSVLPILLALSGAAAVLALSAIFIRKHRTGKQK